MHAFPRGMDLSSEASLWQCFDYAEVSTHNAAAMSVTICPLHVAAAMLATLCPP